MPPQKRPFARRAGESRAERFGHRPEQVGQLIAEAFRRLGASPDQPRLVQLWRNWGMVLGDELASLARPLGLAWEEKPRSGGWRTAAATPSGEAGPYSDSGNLLLLGAEDGMAMQELQLQAEEILERVNAFMEKPFFARVKVSLILGGRPLDRLRSTSRQGESAAAPRG